MKAFETVILYPFLIESSKKYNNLIRSDIHILLDSNI